jgi:CheY-like chemotaxis protein
VLLKIWIKRPLETFDLILLDVMMGPISGFKFADKLHNELKLADTILNSEDMNSA